MLIYDRDCGFCQWSLQVMRRFGATCESRAWQECDLDALGLSLSDVTDAAWFIDGDQKFRGHEAIAQTLRSSRWLPVRILGRIVGSRVLRPVATPAYAWVSRNRHLLPGATQACRIEDQPG